MTISQLLFDPADLPPAVRYQTLFGNLPQFPQQVKRMGRRPLSRNSLLKALIYKALRKLPTLSDLTFELNNNPTISQVLGLNPIDAAPSVERFSAFLHDTPNPQFQEIRRQLVQILSDEEVISVSSVSIDSCPIVVQLKENNLKTSMANRFDKTRRPAGDPDARLGVLIHYPAPNKKEVRYFWGYRNHVVLDTTTELPLCEITHPANVHEIKVAKSLLLQAKEIFHLPIEWVLGDANFDSEDFLTFIIKELNARPIIPHNPRNELKGYSIKNNQVLCEANLPMYRKGKMRPKRTGILYCQYSCPIVYDKTIRSQYITCPVFHPKFFNQKGCNALIRLERSIRDEIGYDTQQFKDLYSSRTAVERVFSRLLSIAMQNPTVRGLVAIQNHATIAHIAVLLVALTAHRTGQKDKIRFVRSFVPKFMSGHDQ